MSALCSHPVLRFTPSTHAGDVGYKRPTIDQRRIAAGKKYIEDVESDDVFPAPLVLPGDDLALDPRYPPQSLRSWLREPHRNAVTRSRNKLYIVGSPEVEKNVDYVNRWAIPQVQDRDATAEKPELQSVADYLAAFYLGMNVQVLPSHFLRFSEWDESAKSKAKGKARFVGLKTALESIRIRARPSLDGVFQGQLNLDDLLDVAISILPEDAYSLLMLVDHDLFEDDDDDFCCGRAYGGSRVAVVSMARYNPTLDASQNVERVHAWPAAHCNAYMEALCEENSPSHKKTSKQPSKRRGAPQASPSQDETPIAEVRPLRPAVNAFLLKNPKEIMGLWLSRVCQTASHELGHCFGIDHCVYYACAMQGTCSLAEDVRQPPYLCPVDLAKVLKATDADERERYQALHSFCNAHAHVPRFAAFGAWLDSRLGANTTVPSKVGSRETPIEL